MNNHLRQKAETLNEILGTFKSTLIAFSGGVDSSLWLKSSADTIPSRALAVTIQPVLCHSGEVAAARGETGEIGVDHQILAFNSLIYEEIRSSHKDCCYRLKKNLAECTCEVFDREPEAAS